MPRITLEGGIKVRTFTPPPVGFDPMTASAAELTRHGFPARPEDPQLLERYKQVFVQIKDRFHYVVPEFKVIDKMRRRVPRRPDITPDDAFPHSYWSGGVVFPPTGQSFRWITGEWTVPNVAALTENQEYDCVTWVGIDGFTTAASAGVDVCQAGIAMDVTRDGTNDRDVYAWWEWFPGGPVAVEASKFPVTFGDTVILTLCTSGPGSTEALVYLVNRTSGVVTSFIPEAPNDQTKLFGDCAEWVVERPGLGETETPALLPDYGQVFFSGCQAVSYSSDGTSSTVVNGGTQVPINMFETATQTLLSEGILVSDTVIQCVFLAPGTGQL
jgi:hypothetical protein